MSVSYALILGAIQGITEFLPISSSAHLVLVPLFFKQDYQGLTFDVAMHMGTLFAIIIYFFKDWWKLLKNAIVAPQSTHGKLFWSIILATLPAPLLGFALRENAETVLRSNLVIAAALVMGSIILWFADKKTKLQKEIKSIGVQGLLFIGFAQALAIIPGISRAGITIAAGLFTGLKREEAAKLSFLMAPPVILGAGLLMMTKLAISDLRLSFFIGFLSAAVFGLLAIKFLLTYLKKAKLSLFIVYRLILGIIIIILTLCRII